MLLTRERVSQDQIGSPPSFQNLNSNKIVAVCKDVSNEVEMVQFYQVK